MCAGVVLWSLAVANAGGDASQAAVAERHSTATLAFLTALGGKSLGDIAAGQVVNVGDLSEGARSQVLDSARSIFVPSSYDRRFSSSVDPDQLVLRLFSDFTVTLSGGGLRSGSVLTIPLASYLPGIDPTLAGSPAGDPPAIPDLPTLDSIVAAAPPGSVERANFLRAQALALLDPVGVYRLKTAGVPVALSQFTTRTPTKLSSLTDADRGWLAGVYRQFYLRATKVGQKVRLASGEGKVVVEGVPSEWLSQPPPVWADLGDVTVEFGVEYGPAIVPASQPNCGAGGGWYLPKIPVR